MRTPRSPLLLGLLFCALLAPPAAHAATLTATLTAALSRDLDLSGGITCGDYLRYSLAVTPDATPPQGVVFDIPVDTNILWDPSSVTTTAPGATITPDPLAIRIAFGTLAAPVTATWEGQIRTLNTGTAVAVQGTLSAPNLANTFTDGNPGLGGDQATVTPYPACAPVPNVRATKTWSLAVDGDGDGLVDPGDSVTYTVLINNGTNPALAATGVVFTSDVDGATALVVGSATTTRGTVVTGNNAADTSLRVNVGNLPANSTASITFQVRVSPGTREVLISCQGIVTGGNFSQTLTDDPTTPAALDPTRTPIDHDPDVSLAKSDGGISATAGQVVPYTLSITSTGYPAVGAVLHESPPAGTAFDASASSAGWSCAGNQCTLAVGSIAAGATVSRTFAVRVASALPAGSAQLVNNASVTHADPDPNPANNLATDTTPLSGLAPDLSLSKSDGGVSAMPGEVLLYTLTVRNLGNVGATGVKIQETVPANSTYAPGAAPGWTCQPDGAAGSSCSLDLAGGLAAGDSQIALFAVSLAPTLPAGTTSLTNTAKAADDGSNGADTDPSNNTATLTTPITGAAPDLNVQKTLDPSSSAVPGGTLLYNLAYSNTGNLGAPLLVQEAVPQNTTFLPGASTSGWSCAAPAAGSACTYDAGTIPAGGQGLVRFAVRIDPTLPAGTTSILNCAQVRTHGVARLRAAQDCLPVPVAARLDLAIAKTDGGISAAIGDTIAYTLTASNLGTLDASGVSLAEIVPDNSTFDPGSSSPGWTCTGLTSGSPCSYALAGLAAGESRSVVFAIHTLESPSEDFLAWINTARITDDGAGGPDADPSNNLASDQTPVGTLPNPNASLVVLKTDDLVEDRGLSGAADPRDVIRYTVTVRNDSPTTARDAVYSILSADPYALLIRGTVTTDTGVVTQGNARSDHTVRVDLGNLPGGAVATITFDVRVVDQLPAAVTAIAYQGVVSGSNAPAVASDDPDTPEIADPTRTLVAPRDVHDIPTLGGLGLLALGLAFAFLAARRLRLHPASATAPRSLPHA